MDKRNHGPAGIPTPNAKGFQKQLPNTPSSLPPSPRGSKNRPWKRAHSRQDRVVSLKMKTGSRVSTRKGRGPLQVHSLCHTKLNHRAGNGFAPRGPCHRSPWRPQRGPSLCQQHPRPAPQNLPEHLPLGSQGRPQPRAILAAPRQDSPPGTKGCPELAQP